MKLLLTENLPRRHTAGGRTNKQERSNERKQNDDRSDYVWRTYRGQTAASVTRKPAAPTAGIVTEKHYTPAELAAMWNFSPSTIRRLISDEQGVLRLAGLGPTAGKRSYTTYSVPASVADRIHQRLREQPLKTVLPRRNPRRVVFFRDGDG